MIAILSLTRIALVVAIFPANRVQDADIYTRTLKATALIFVPTGNGTAWVVDVERRLLVTSEHVVGRHAEVEVIFPVYGTDRQPLAEPAHYNKVRRIRADVIDVDGPRDLALIRLREPPPAGVTTLKVADHDPRPAERIHAIGNPDASGALWVY